MLYFSELGLMELRSLAQQSAPFLRSEDRIRLVQLVGQIGPDRAVSETAYDQMVQIIERYTKKREFEKDCAAEKKVSEIEQQTIEKSDKEALLLNFRYYLLSYSGIADLRNRAVVYDNEKNVGCEVGGQHG